MCPKICFVFLFSLFLSVFFYSFFLSLPSDVKGEFVSFLGLCALSGSDSFSTFNLSVSHSPSLSFSLHISPVFSLHPINPLFLPFPTLFSILIPFSTPL
ncbi:hypothetical protein RJT34_18098 [Clitoria ternatea]|uniref:Uncharacterized protein n=1 Tax=Clitoria ternatea TaxID=43366 RepID=A0AAN9JAH6_CLITE